MVKDLPTNSEDEGSVSESGRSPGEGKGYPLQYYGLENPMDHIVHGVFQARVLEWFAISFSRGSSHPRDRTHVSELQADALTSEPSGKPLMNTLWVTKSKVWENGSGSSTALSLLADET